MRWWTQQQGEVECSEDGEMPFSIWATKADVTAAQAAIIAEITKMSSTLESQLQTLTANIAADAAAVKADLDTILAGMTPGSQITQADIDALTALSSSMDALKTAADAGANPAPAPAPGP